MTDVPIQIHNRPFVPATINGLGPFMLLLDTGCIGWRMTTAAARRLGLHPDDDGGVCLQTLAIGSARWRDVRFGVGDDPAVTRLVGRAFDGFLGNGFLLHVRDAFSLTIHYPKQTLAFVPRQPPAHKPERESHVNLSIENRYTIVPVRVNGEGPYRFLLDTGASTCIVAQRLAAELGLPQGAAATAKGAADALPVFRSSASQLSVGAAARRDLDVLLMDCTHVSDYVHEPIDGYLGTNFLKHFTITLDYADQTLGCR